MPTNGNWQQYIPMAMASLAGALDPRFSNQIAQGGWQAARMQMMQEQWQRQQEQQEKENKRAENYLKMYESREQRESDRYAREKEIENQRRLIFENLGSLYDMDPDKPGAMLGALNKMLKEGGSGAKIDAGVFYDVYENSKIFPADTGQVVFNFDEKTGAFRAYHLYKGAKGVVRKEYDIAKEGITPQMMEALQRNPEMQLLLADQEEKKGNLPVAQAMRNAAKRIIGDKELEERKVSLLEREEARGALKDIYEAETASWAARYTDPQTKDWLEPYREGQMVGQTKLTKEQAASMNEAFMLQGQEEKARIDAKHARKILASAPGLQKDYAKLVSDENWARYAQQFIKTPAEQAVYTAAADEAMKLAISRGVDDDEKLKEEMRLAGVAAVLELRKSKISDVEKRRFKSPVAQGPRPAATPAAPFNARQQAINAPDPWMLQFMKQRLQQVPPSGVPLQPLFPTGPRNPWRR